MPIVSIVFVIANSGVAVDATSLNARSETPPEIVQEKSTAPRPVFAGLDVFGSSRLNETVLRKTFGTEIDQWIKMGLAGDPNTVDLERRIAGAIRTKFDLASADWSVLQYVEEGRLVVYATLDVVEKKDVSRRAGFNVIPKSELPDPGGLIAEWQEYQKTALGLVSVGEVRIDTEDCEAFHCPFGHKHPKLQKYEKIFLEGAKTFGKELAEILVKDGRAEIRGAAVFLLAYLKDGKTVVERVMPAVRDPEDLVRNNALRVLIDIAQYHSEIPVPVKTVVEALDFPSASDRSKAANVVYFLALGAPQVRQYLMDNALPKLVSLVASVQPEQRVTAHAILRKLSGKNLAATDIQGWSNWSKKAGQGRTVSQQ